MTSGCVNPSCCCEVDDLELGFRPTTHKPKSRPHPAGPHVGKRYWVGAKRARWSEPRLRIQVMGVWIHRENSN